MSKFQPGDMVRLIKKTGYLNLIPGCVGEVIKTTPKGFWAKWVGVEWTNVEGYTPWFHESFAERLVNKTPEINSTSSMELTTTTERVLEASIKYPESRGMLKTLFPQVFEPQTYDFGKSHLLLEEKPGSSFSIVPLTIGNNLVVKEMNGKCLLLNPMYTMKVQEIHGSTFLSFQRKEPTKPPTP